MSGTHNSPKRFTTPNSRGKETVIAPQPQPQLQQAQPQTQPSKVPIQRESESYLGSNFQSMNPSTTPIYNNIQSQGMNQMMNQPQRAPNLQGIQTASTLGRLGGTNQLSMTGMPTMRPTSQPIGGHQVVGAPSNYNPYTNKPVAPNLRVSTGSIPNYNPTSTPTPEFVQQMVQGKTTPGMSVNSFQAQQFPFMPNSMRATGLGGKNDQEFNLGGEDFPALPGVKGGPSDGSVVINNSIPTSNSVQGSLMQFTKTQSYESVNPTLRSTQPQQTYDPFRPILQPQLKKLADRFGLIGLLSVIRMTDPDLTTLALGIDLTTLGLNLNSADCLYNTFTSPFADSPSRREPDYYIPACYSTQAPPLQPPIAKMGLFSEQTLFYIFYSMPKDVLQTAAASELFKRSWRYHKEHRIWISQVPGVEVIKSNGVERGSFYYFDITLWEKVRRDNFALALDQLVTSESQIQI